MIRLTVAALAAALTAFAAVPASAENANASRTVAFGDLDLATAAGAQELDQRIERAARRACRGARSTGSNISEQRYCRAAFREAVIEAMPERQRHDYAAARTPEEA